MHRRTKHGAGRGRGAAEDVLDAGEAAGRRRGSRREAEGGRGAPCTRTHAPDDKRRAQHMLLSGITYQVRSACAATTQATWG